MEITTTDRNAKVGKIHNRFCFFQSYGRSEWRFHWWRDVIWGDRFLILLLTMNSRPKPVSKTIWSRDNTIELLNARARFGSKVGKIDISFSAINNRVRLLYGPFRRITFGHCYLCHKINTKLTFVRWLWDMIVLEDTTLEAAVTKTWPRYVSI